MVDQQYRESNGKAKIEGYMRVSDEQAHHWIAIFVVGSVDTCYPLTKYCSTDLFTLYVMYNLLDVYWDVLNDTLSPYYPHI